MNKTFVFEILMFLVVNVILSDCLYDADVIVLYYAGLITYIMLI